VHRHHIKANDPCSVEAAWVSYAGCHKVKDQDRLAHQAAIQGLLDKALAPLSISATVCPMMVDLGYKKVSAFGNGGKVYALVKFPDNKIWRPLMSSEDGKTKATNMVNGNVPKDMKGGIAIGRTVHDIL